jgi:ribosomal protein S18 acetylase RimI-like enzyme
MAIVRPAERSDLGVLARCVAGLPLLVRYGQSAERLEDSLRGALDRGDGVLVYDDGAPRGFAWFMPTGTFGVGGYLRLIALSADVQRAGAGSALLCAFESAVFALAAHAFLLVSDFNTEAQRFYERHGYRQVGSLPGFVLPEVTELIYWKPRPAVQ